VAAAFDRDAIRRRIPGVDEMFGSGDEIIEDVLLVLEHAGAVPRFAVLAAAAEVRKREHAAVLEEWDVARIECGSAADVESAIAAEQHAAFAVDREVLP